MSFFIILPDFHNQYKYMGGIFDINLLSSTIGTDRKTMDTTPLRLFPTASFTILAPTTVPSYATGQTFIGDDKANIRHKGLDINIPSNDMTPDILLTSIPNTLSWLDGVHKDIVNQPDIVNVEKYAKFTNLNNSGISNNEGYQESLLRQLHTQEYHRQFPFGQRGERPPGYRWYYWPLYHIYRWIIPHPREWLNEKRTQVFPYKKHPIWKFEFHMKSKTPFLSRWSQAHSLPYPRFKPKIPSNIAYDININNIMVPTSVYALFRDLSSTLAYRPYLKNRKKRKKLHLHAQEHENRPLVLLDPSFGISQFGERPLGNFEALELLTFVFIFLASVLYIFSVLRLYFIALGT